MKHFSHDEAGFSLMSAIMGVGILGFLALGTMKILSHGQRGSAKVNANVEITALKMTLLQSISCSKTLEVDPDTTGLSCSSSRYKSLTIKDKWGDPLTRSGKIGRWYVRARCVDNSIKIGVYRKGRDPLTKKPWANKAIAKDVFGGVTNFCKKYFMPGLNEDLDSPGSTINVDIVEVVPGPAGKDCMKRTVINSNAVTGCGENEYLLSGGGSCNSDRWAETGFTSRYKKAIEKAAANGQNDKRMKLEAKLQKIIASMDRKVERGSTEFKFDSSMISGIGTDNKSCM